MAILWSRNLGSVDGTFLPLLPRNIGAAEAEILRSKSTVGAPASPVFSRAMAQQQVFRFACARPVGDSLPQSLYSEKDVGPEVVMSDHIRRRHNLRCSRQVLVVGLRASLKQKLMHSTCSRFLRIDL
jgi:hypothetical protein